MWTAKYNRINQMNLGTLEKVIKTTEKHKQNRLLLIFSLPARQPFQNIL